jgi:transcriptional regulator with XRE-family HTH domain
MGSTSGAGQSRPELARKAGISASTLRHWEEDRGFPGLPALVRLAEALGVPVERFAEGVEDPHDDEPEGRRRNHEGGSGKTRNRGNEP